MLNRVHIDNYRCMVDFDCAIAARQLILGSNGAGKSTLFEVFSLLRDFCVRGQPADGRFVGPTKTRWLDVANQTFELEVGGNGGEYKFQLVVDSVGIEARARVVKEELHYDGTPIFRFVQGEVQLFNDRLDGKAYVKYPFDWNRSALATITERKDNTKLSWFKRWLLGLQPFIADPRRMSALSKKETAFPAADLSDFADWYRHLRQQIGHRELGEFMSDLRDAIVGFESMDLPEVGLGNRVLTTSFLTDEGRGTAKSHSFTFDELSDGQRILIGLYTILHFAVQPDATICFDEPDNYIALRELQPWLNKVLDRVDNGAQVLIISHHPELLNRMAFQDGLLLDRPDGRHTRSRRFDDTSQTGLSPAELVARGWERE